MNINPLRSRKQKRTLVGNFYLQKDTKGREKVKNPFRIFSKRSYSLPSASVPLINFSDGVTTGIASGIDSTTIMNRNSDVFSVVNRISSDVSACEFKTQEPFLSVLNRPSKLIDSNSFWKTVVSSMLLNGNAYVVMNFNDDGIVDGLEFVPVNQVNVQIDDYGANMTYRVDFNDERGSALYKADEILHFRLLADGTDKVNTFIGKSPLLSLARDIQLQEESKRLGLSTLVNAINPSYVLEIPTETPLDVKAKEAIRKAFAKSVTGNNAGKAIILDNSMKMKPISLDNNIFDLLKNYTFSQSQVAKAFGIPGSYLDSSKGDQQSNVEQLRGLYANSLQMYIRPIESELSFKFGVPVKLDETVAIDFDNQTLINNVRGLVADGVIDTGTAYNMLEKRGVI